MGGRSLSIIVKCPKCLQERTIRKNTNPIFCQKCRNKESSKKRIYILQDRVGKKYGLWTVVSLAARRKKIIYWLCKCACGTLREVAASSLKRVKSCGCLTRKFDGKSRTNKQALNGSYNSYHSMIARCYNIKASSYTRYGGNGISVCSRWKESFLNFLEDMGERPEGTSLDRKNNAGNYNKENCRWASLSEQARNKTKNRMLTAFGKTQMLIEWAKEMNINCATLCTRYYRGWSPEDCLKPINNYKKNL